jgi:hypothetical protein
MLLPHCCSSKICSPPLHRPTTKIGRVLLLPGCTDGVHTALVPATLHHLPYPPAYTVPAEAAASTLKTPTAPRAPPSATALRVLRQPETCTLRRP